MVKISDNTHATFIEPGSFRDRSGRVFYNNGTVYRGINQQVYENWKILSSTNFFRTLTESGKIVATQNIDRQEIPDAELLHHWAAVLRHQTIPFVSYPYEWSFGMLKDAALLQLELIDKALDEHMTLKDASSFNIQWVGAMPIFIDIPSFERYVSGTPWVGYRQFCEMFLYPLMLQAYKNISFQPFLRGNIDGIPADECNNTMSFRDRLRSGVFLDVYLQAKLQKKFASSTQGVKKDLQGKGFRKEMIKSNLRRLTKIIRRLQWQQKSSEWSDYAEQNSYSQADETEKENFVRAVISSRKRDLVWDLGCNTGKFSRIAAENSGYVVSMDYDHLAIEKFYQKLKVESRQSILPLTINLADPSPALGWRGLERKTLVERGTPDLALCLALIHHLVITANIPLKEFINWLAMLKCDIIIEFVSKDDPMTKILLKNKEDQYAEYEQENFEKCLAEHFHVARREPLSSGTRILYFGQPL